ncbi:MAG: hypothetical protein ABI041_15325 [Bdellovibrionia bacterium]
MVNSPNARAGAVKEFLRFLAKSPLSSQISMQNLGNPTRSFVTRSNAKKAAVAVGLTTLAVTYAADPYLAPTLIPYLNSKLQDPQKLLLENKLQEAIWHFEQMGEDEKVKELKQQLSQILLHSKGKRLFSGIGGASVKVLLFFGNGISGIFKPYLNSFVNPGAEVAAYKIDQLLNLNLVPLTIPYSYEGVDGSLQVFIQDKSTGGYRFSYQFRRMLLLDYLIGNTDRHMDNWMCTTSGFQAIAIDNAFASGKSEVGAEPRFDSNSGMIFEPTCRRFFLKRLDEATKARLLDLRDEVVSEALLDILDPEAVELILGRLHQLQDYLKI